MMSFAILTIKPAHGSTLKIFAAQHYNFHFILKFHYMDTRFDLVAYLLAQICIYVSKAPAYAIWVKFFPRLVSIGFKGTTPCEQQQCFDILSSKC